MLPGRSVLGLQKRHTLPCVRWCISANGTRDSLPDVGATSNRDNTPYSCLDGRWSAIECIILNVWTAFPRRRHDSSAPGNWYDLFGRSTRQTDSITETRLARVLLVEDEAVLRDTIAYNLHNAGHEVQAVGDGETALRAVRDSLPDLAVLDIMLPTIDGFEVLRQIRRTSSIPILMLTARDDEIDRVVGLEIGADDYLTKPFSMRELVARVKALLRRRDLLHDELSNQETAENNIIQAGELEIDLGAHRVLVAGNEVNLKPREWDLLVFLARHSGQVCTNDQILQNVWGPDFFGDSRTVAVHIHGLREKLEPHLEDGRRFIETVRGVGYRFSV